MLNSHWRAFTIDAQEIPQCDCAFVWITSRTILPLPDFRSASAMPGEDLSEINRSLHQGADAPSDKIKDETIAISEKLLQLPGIQGTRYRGRLGWYLRWDRSGAVRSRSESEAGTCRPWSAPASESRTSHALHALPLRGRTGFPDLASEDAPLYR